ncbi:MAG: hypothetical protein AAF658_07085 [Myxococcota bacterium]
MKKLMLAAALLGLGSACGSTSSFVLTGTERGAIPEDAPVKPYLTGLPQVPFTEIGVVEVRGTTLKRRVERASEMARRKGGNAIVHLNSNTHVRGSPGLGAAWVGPLWLGRGAGFGFGTGQGAQVQSVEVDRYIIVFIDPDGIESSS